MSSLKKSVVVLFAVVSIVGWAAYVQADTVNGVNYIDPLSAAASSYSPENGGNQSALPSHTIDSSGLTASNGYCTTHTCAIYPTSGPRTVFYTAYGTGGATAPGGAWISWDLGASYSLAGFHLWNYNGDDWGDGLYDFSGRGVYQGSIYVSSDGINWGAPVQSYTFARAPCLDTYTGEDYAFTATQTARYVKLLMTENYFQLLGGSLPDYTPDDPEYCLHVGLSEIRFIAVPEPTTLALLACGLASLLAYAWRKRKCVPSQS